jgi:dihydrofolate reductase
LAGCDKTFHKDSRATKQFSFDPFSFLIFSFLLFPYSIWIVVKLIIIAALSRNLVIGKDGKVPWDIPEDVARFKRFTRGHTVLMGRRSYETLEDPLTQRRNVVLTSHTLPGVETYPSIAVALERLHDQDKVYVIGGGEIFRAMLTEVDEWNLTHVEREVEGDTFFPPYEHLVGTRFILSNEVQRQGYRFSDYVRRA